MGRKKKKKSLSLSSNDNHSITGEEEEEENNIVLIDDHSTAWEERKREGKSWGGKGYGGRGIQSHDENISNIHLQNVSLQFLGNELLQDATIQITKCKRYGLIGKNGTGKSCLLRQIASKAIPGFPSKAKVLLLQQDNIVHNSSSSSFVSDQNTKSAIQTLLDADEELTFLSQQMRKIEIGMESEDNPHKIESMGKELSEIMNQLDIIDADNAENRARKILSGLQFSPQMMESLPAKHLSGGWKMRLSLAKSLFIKSDILLLDEPTNHLDIYACFWLEEYLTDNTGDQKTIIVVSHDTAFLDRVCTDIIHFHHKKLKYYPGNYSAYQKTLHDKATHEAQIVNAANRQREKAMDFISENTSKQNNKKRNTIDPKKQKQAKTKEKKLDRLGRFREDGKRYKNFSLKKFDAKYSRASQHVLVLEEDPPPHFKLPNPYPPTSSSSINTMVRLEGYSFAYNDSLPNILENITCQIRCNSKIALVGRNGHGKTTLLNAIRGSFEATEEKKTDSTSSTSSSFVTKGRIWRHPTLKIAYLAQHDVENLIVSNQNKTKTVAEYAQEQLQLHQHPDYKTKTSVRQYLGGFSLSGNKIANRQISHLSGGERMRLCLACHVFATQPQIIILDEPTNHLDIETLDALAQALYKFEGAILIVSHNQHFLCGFCNELWILDKKRIQIEYSRDDHNDDDGGLCTSSSSFEENFTNFKQQFVSGMESRSKVREEKVALSKQISMFHKNKKQTDTRGGFIR